MLEVIRDTETVSIGLGCYTAPEAARLLKASTRTISRWLEGGAYRDSNGKTVETPPLWTPQWPRLGGLLEIGFLDLIELRFVVAFVEHGVSPYVIRLCHENARAIFGDERPFSKPGFRTDGRSVFLESAREADRRSKASLPERKTREMVFKEVVEQKYRDLDFVDGSVAKWRPHGGKTSIVIDPNRSFGKAIAANYGVPTAALANAVRAEDSAKRAAGLFEVPLAIVNDAVAYERSLMAT